MAVGIARPTPPYSKRKRCIVCDELVEGNRKRRTCSNACRMALYRFRRRERERRGFNGRSAKGGCVVCGRACNGLTCTDDCRQKLHRWRVTRLSQ